MRQQFREIAFTTTVKGVQEALGTRQFVESRALGETANEGLGPNEAAFLAARDNFYMASVSETGWPYVQHRGGPAGFVRVLDEKTIGFADFTGNRQYISVGNLMKDDRVSLIFMDYANQARLKFYGRVRLIDAEDMETLEKLIVPDYRARIERGFLISVEAFDWNCPQHIVPRFTVREIEPGIRSLKERIAELESELAKYRADIEQAGGP